MAESGLTSQAISLPQAGEKYNQQAFQDLLNYIRKLDEDFYKRSTHVEIWAQPDSGGRQPLLILRSDDGSIKYSVRPGDPLSGVAGSMGVDWSIVDGQVVPFVNSVPFGLYPPTLSAGVFTIVSEGFYLVSGFFAIDTGGANSVGLTIQHNGVNKGLAAGAVQSGGQGGTVFQPTAKAYIYLGVGDTIQIMAEADSIQSSLLFGSTAVDIQQLHG
jgi:hypothetical protein